MNIEIGTTLKEMSDFIQSVQNKREEEELNVKLEHHITKYRSNGTKFAESWLQLSILDCQFCFSRQIIKID